MKYNIAGKCVFLEYLGRFAHLNETMNQIEM